MNRSTPTGWIPGIWRITSPERPGVLGDFPVSVRAASHGRQQSMARVAPGGRGGSMLRIQWPSRESSK